MTQRNYRGSRGNGNDHTGNGGQNRNGGTGNGGRNGGEKKAPPVFRLGPIIAGSGESVSAAVWATPMRTDEGKEFSSFRVSTESSYFDKDKNEWRTGHAFKPSQLGALQYMLTECARFVFENSVPQNGEIPQ